MKTKSKKNVVNIFLVAIIFSVLTWLGIEEYKEKNIKEESYKVENVSTNASNSNEKEYNKIEEVYEKEEVALEYKGYDVIAKLEIPEISLETYILKKK